MVFSWEVVVMMVIMFELSLVRHWHGLVVQMQEHNHIRVILFITTLIE